MSGDRVRVRRVGSGPRWAVWVDGNYIAEWRDRSDAEGQAQRIREEVRRGVR